MNIIAIDCGASFIKGALFIDNSIQTRVQKKAPTVNKSEDNILNPVQIECLVNLFIEMLKELSRDLSAFTLCISNEMHGFVLANEDGSPYTEYISWQNEYGAILIDECSSLDVLKRQVDEKEIEATGMPLRSGLPSCNLFYLNRKGMLVENLYFYTLGDYLIRRISKQQPIAHMTNAAATGLADIIQRNWNYKLINKIYDKKIVFPNIGEEKISFQLDGKEVICLPAVGDQQAALYGAGLENVSELSFNLGTGAQVSRLTERVLFSDKYQVRPYFHNMYLQTIPHLPSGRAINVYVRFCLGLLEMFDNKVEEDYFWRKILDNENDVKDSGLTCELSFFETPFSEKVVGCIEDIGEYDLNVANLFHSAFNEMSRNYLMAADIVAGNKAEIGKIVFSGGIARKIKKIRDNILLLFPADIDYVVGENETLIGLNKYGNEL